VSDLFEQAGQRRLLVSECAFGRDEFGGAALTRINAGESIESDDEFLEWRT